MIIPGNADTHITENWFSYIAEKLEKLGLDVIAKDMPDPDLAREEFWLPFIEQQTKKDEDLILIGHSSGAVAVLRYLETHKCRLAILVGVCHTDLGSEHEARSGYFSKEWRWNTIKNNADKIIIFASRDDPYIPIIEPVFIKEKLDAEYHEYKDEGHFGGDKGKIIFPEIITLIRKFLDK